MSVKNPYSRSNLQIVPANLKFLKDLIKGQQRVHSAYFHDAVLDPAPIAYASGIRIS